MCDDNTKTIKLKVITEEEREKLRIPRYKYILK